MQSAMTAASSDVSWMASLQGSLILLSLMVVTSASQQNQESSQDLTPQGAALLTLGRWNRLHP